MEKTVKTVKNMQTSAAEKVIVTIPAYNEENTIGKVVTAVKGAIKQYPHAEVLVLNDGSKDRTADIARKAGAIVVSNPTNLGLARTFQREIEECLARGADIIVHTDADGQYPAGDIPKLVDAVRSGTCMLALGNRFTGGIERMPLVKRIGNKLSTMLVSVLSHKYIGDAQTGFRAFTKEVAQNCPITGNYTYTQEQIIKAAWKGFTIAEIPAHFFARADESRLMRNPLHYAVNLGITIVRLLRDYSPVRFFSSFGALFLLGSLASTITAFLPTGENRVVLLVLAAILLVGAVQLFLAGILADMFRKTA